MMCINKSVVLRLLLGLPLLIPSCEATREASIPQQQAAQSTAQSKGIETASPSHDDTQKTGDVLSQEGNASNWQHMKECAEQVDRIVIKEHLASGSPTLVARENHYSPKYNRCYVRFSYPNSEAAAKNPELPSVYSELWDAFEEKLLSVCTDERVFRGGRVFCTIQDKDNFMNCDVCRQFVKDRMTK